MLTVRLTETDFTGYRAHYGAKNRQTNTTSKDNEETNKEEST